MLPPQHTQDFLLSSTPILNCPIQNCSDFSWQADFPGMLVPEIKSSAVALDFASLASSAHLMVACPGVGDMTTSNNLHSSGNHKQNLRIVCPGVGDMMTSNNLHSSGNHKQNLRIVCPGVGDMMTSNNLHSSGNHKQNLRIVCPGVGDDVKFYTQVGITNKTIGKFIQAREMILSILHSSGNNEKSYSIIYRTILFANYFIA